MRIKINEIENGCYFFFFLLAFLGLHPWLMEVPRLGVQLELQLLASATATPDLKLHPTPQLTAMPDP